ncbi:hypothetical protein LPJ64_001632 [Coemansia asiatica]|uniref:Uncharacterized protein n=1 Tax=Coemansia asiatica TaxID=1052880 RepID=A0A9W8CJU1_9FUNG|nr:hypothetical protein LPJ64_001632 [Coemansia asiatica]
MVGSPLKGADAFIVKRRPVLRALTYAALFIMCIINLSMLSSSWSNAEFMRRNGSFTGAFNIASSLATMVASGLLAIATAMLIRENTNGWPLSRFSLRMTSDQTEKIIACFMVAWWFALSFSISNMLFVFRDDIRRCINYRSHRPKHGSVVDLKALQVAATACTVFKGSVVLNWMIWLTWAVRAWRTFTRSNIHFDSNIFREPSNSELDMYSIKPVGPPMLINPATFSPRHPGAPGGANQQQMQQQVLNDSHYDDSASEQTNESQQYRINANEPVNCPNCRHSIYNRREHHQQELPQPRQAPVYHQAVMFTQNRPANNNVMAHHMQKNVAQQQNHAGNCCQTPVVGTATLATEPVVVPLSR